MLSGGTKRRVLPQHQSAEMKILNIVGIRAKPKKKEITLFRKNTFKDDIFKSRILLSIIKQTSFVMKPYRDGGSMLSEHYVLL